jgi:hypothetical protein
MVNPVTNKIYVANSETCGGVTVTDAGTGHMTRIKAGTQLDGISVNPVTNKIYAYDPETVTVIDAATNKTMEVLLPIPSKMPGYANLCSSNQGLDHVEAQSANANRTLPAHVRLTRRTETVDTAAEADGPGKSAAAEKLPLL